MEVVICVSCGNEIFNDTQEDVMCSKCKENEHLKEIIKVNQHEYKELHQRYMKLKEENQFLNDEIEGLEKTVSNLRWTLLSKITKLRKYEAE